MTINRMTKSLASLVLAATATFAATVRSIRRRRAQQRALRDLLAMDPRRLDDLGIDADDVREALSAPPPAKRFLETRRTLRAAAWTPAPRAAA